MTASRSAGHCHRARMRRGTVAIAMIIVMTVISLVIVGMVLGGARDHDLTVPRLETVRAFYAAEAGVNMALREIAQDADEDGDGVVGTISDDDNSANNPVIGSSSVYVAQQSGAGQTTVIAHGISGSTRRRFETTVVGSSGGGAGLRAEYFASPGVPAMLSNIDWSATPTRTTLVSQINFAVTSGQSWPSGPTNNWGRRYTGKINIPQTGTWTFYTNSDDGSKLWIDGTLVVNNDGLHAMTLHSGSISLTAGLHDIEIQWFERNGVFGLIASWSGPGVPSPTAIPATAFSH